MAIHCQKCGVLNRDSAKFCASCQAPLTQALAAGQPSSGGPVGVVDRKLGFPFVGILVGGICLVYLINPTAGVLELIPDNLPIVGNLDEAAAMTGLLASLASIGLIEWRGGRPIFQGWAGVRGRWPRS